MKKSKSTKSKRSGGSSSSRSSRSSRSSMSSRGRKFYSSSRSSSRSERYSSSSKKILYTVVGILQSTQRDFGFVLVPDGTDIFVAMSKFNGAMHGDTVKVEVWDTDRGPEGRVVAITQNSDKNIVGTFVINKGNIATVIPDDTRYGKQYIVQNEYRKNAIDNDKVVIKLIEQDGENLYCKVTEVLGQSGDMGIDILSVLREYGISETFDKKVIRESKALPTEVDEKELTGRTDFRNELIVTIDGDDTKDIDDAVSVVKTTTGYKLSVHIADVSHYVKPNSEIDQVAFKRGTSTYFANNVIPMLPKDLSNGICSLNPGVDRLTLSLTMYIDNKGKVTGSDLVQGVVNTKQLTYSLVTKILAGEADKEYDYLKPMLETSVELSKILTARRVARGSIDFAIDEAKITFDTKGHPIDIQKVVREQSHMLIEEFMLLANETIAKKFATLKTPFVYRVHLQPDQKKLDSILNFINVFGIKLKGNIDDIHSKDLSDMLNSAQHSPIYKTLSTVTLRAQMKATYEASNLGHFGLASKYYCHFTSPIRRYPDLMIHRIITQYLLNPKKLNQYEPIVKPVAKQSSIRERVSVEVERKIESLKKAQYMQDKIGQIFTGKISGIISNAIFVELENTVEGRIDIQSLPDDLYIYDQNTMSLTGKKHKYMLCDSIKVILKSVIDDKINFGVSEE